MKKIPAGSKSQHLISSPAYYWNPQTRLALLREEVRYETPVHGFRAAAEGAALDSDGALVCRDGFVWDLGSGPALNTPGMVYASLAHDAFYDMMNAGSLPWSQRKKVDAFFKQQMKDFGVPWLVRGWRHGAVRLFYRAWSALGRVWERIK